MNEKMKMYVELAGFLAKSIARTYEIIVFDLTDSEYPIVCHYNRISSTVKPTRRLIKEALKNRNVREIENVLNRMIETETHKMIKTSLRFIKEDEKIVGAFCLNLSCNVYLEVQGVLSDLVKFDMTEMEQLKTDEAESSKTYVEPSFNMITEIIQNNSDDPMRMTPGERADAMCDLYNAGVFELKGAVPKVAEAMGMSSQSVYRYVSKIRKARG